MYATALRKRLLSYAPLRQALIKTGGTGNARYCYSVWLRHLTMAFRKNPRFRMPEVVAELGPGDSLGIGLAAMLSGARKYYAFDVVRYSDVVKNAAILDELVGLFREKAPIPGNGEFPDIKPLLDSHAFPDALLTDDHLTKALSLDRIAAIRRALFHMSATDERSPAELSMSYYVPWHSASVIEQHSVDMIYSQAVMEHVDDLPNAYSAMRRWLKPGGLVSHQIDFRSHGTSRRWWNGHWEYPAAVWTFLRGNRPYLINRQPLSTHTRLLAENGFNVVEIVTCTDRTGIPRKRLSAEFRGLSDEDLTTSGAFVQAVL